MEAMQRTVFYTILLILVACVSSYGQMNKVIITATDTIYFDVHSDVEEVSILTELYEKTNGSKWKTKTNWLKGKSISDVAGWHGVVVANGDVVEVHLDNNNLNGVIPMSLYDLKRLRSVSFAGNQLSVAASAGRADVSLQNAPDVEMMATNAVAGKNLPFWGIAAEGSIQTIDWRIRPPFIENLLSSGAQRIGPSAVGIDDCGRLAFYLVHTGKINANNEDEKYQLNIYSATGVKLTNDINGDALRALNSVAGNNEIQVVRVPGKTDEWYIVYSLNYGYCGEPTRSFYCAAKVVYAKIKYDITTQTLLINSAEREIPLSSVASPQDTYGHGKAVSRDRVINGVAGRHYLFLARRSTTEGNTYTDNSKIHRYIISESGINFDLASAKLIPLGSGGYVGAVDGASVELSPDENTLAYNNRVAATSSTDHFLLFDLNRFSDASYDPIVVNVQNLRMQVPDTQNPIQTIKQFATNVPQHTCLQYVSNKLTGLQFSPSGRYLYVVGGGYVDKSSGSTNSTYLLQIDLQSASLPGGKDFMVNLQVQKGYGITVGGCTGGSPSNVNDHSIRYIESAYDGRIYFTKTFSPFLYVIPHPDDPMPHNIVPVDDVNLSNAAATNIRLLPSASALLNMPEGIDGQVYLKESSIQNFTLDKTTVIVGGSVTLTISAYSSSIHYQVDWGDGTIEPVTSRTKRHSFNTPGTIKITLTAKAQDNCTTLTSKTITVQPAGCPPVPTVAITDKTYLCAVKFKSTDLPLCSATYLWNLGDGTTSAEKNPMHVYSSGGVFNVTLTVNYNCGGCTGSQTINKTVTYLEPPVEFENITIDVVTDQKLEVLSSSALTFSDAWPMNHLDKTLANKNGFVNGSRGVWRNEASYVYEKERKLSPVTNLATDGTFTLEQFSWKYEDLEAVPFWIKASTMSRYSPYSYELENKDVLGIYSSAVYDYGGHLTVATGGNMRSDEMAFTSFEYLNGSVGGNWIIANQSDLPAYSPDYTLINGRGNEVVIKANLQQLANVVDIEVTAYYLRNIFSIKREIITTKLVCARAHPDTPEWSVIVIETAPDTRTENGKWYGSLKFKNIVASPVSSTLDKTFGHSGKSSLKITSDKAFKQELIKLIPGKSYMINGWVSVKTPAAPTLPTGVGVNINFKRRDGTAISTIQFAPSGVIIEGWQQMRGVFVCPANTDYIELKFKRGSAATVWYDDLRLQTENGNMKAFVYSLVDYRLQAILDEENFASFFYYDKEGNLHLTKRETQDGIKTTSENISYQVER
jgi:PKD repeat protein